MYSNTSIHVRQASDGRHELNLDGEVNVFSASQLHQEAVRLADSGQDVLVCCERVESLDASALQILVALKESLAVQGKTFQLRGLSEPLLDAIRLTGLAKQLACDDRQCEREQAEPHEATAAALAFPREV